MIMAVTLSGISALGLAGATRGQSARTSAIATQVPPPYWAYAINPPAKPDDAATGHADEALRQVPGSTAAFTHAQINNFFGPPDWHPDGHTPMPEIVARGRKPDVFACGYCHLPNGQGRPENSSLAGLPAEYIVQQMADFKSGLRKSSDPKDLPVATMIANETKANEKEIHDAAVYFSGLKLKPWIRVVETDIVPKTKVAGWMLVPIEGAGTEPIGQRIIETPENLEQIEMRNDAVGFVAYVPIGSVKRGGTLVTTGGEERTVACGKCHGTDLRGLANVPNIAGRSPSYVVRQLYDMQNGTRAGAAAQLMKPVVAKLSVDDMVAIAAFLASLKP
jgi:cytochrome c553